MKILNVVGARPNFMKIAPLMAEYRRFPFIVPMLVHTGQHYDEKMSDLFFRQLGIPEPDINLEVGSASHAVQTAEIMKAFEPILLEHRPDAVLVVGDVNSTVACGLVAVKLGIKLVHVEAGLRSGDRSMPEEINRIVTDAISDILFCTEQAGVENLHREGVPPERVHWVGHVMIDTLLQNLEKARQSSAILEQLKDGGCIDGTGYALLTLHRPSNVDRVETFESIAKALDVIQKDVPILFPVHPRTRKIMAETPLGLYLSRLPRLHLMEPLGYLDFVRLLASARVVLTDSGGIQEETTALGIPCLTLRDNTERPVTVEVGSNTLVGTDSARIVETFKKVLAGNGRKPEVPPLWDGRASERIVRVLIEALCPDRVRPPVIEAVSRSGRPTRAGAESSSRPRR